MTFPHVLAFINSVSLFKIVEEYSIVWDIHLFKNIWVVFHFWLLCISLPQTFVHEPLCEYMLSFLLDSYLGVAGMH